MTKKEFRLLGFYILIWTWRDEIRMGAKGRRGLGIIIETALINK